MHKYISKLDTDRFGIPVARINRFDRPVREMIDGFKAIGVHLIISRVSAADVALINEMEQQGFRHKDVQITHCFHLDRPIPCRAATGNICREFRPEDTRAITDIASRAFTDYGHYSRLELTRTVDTSEIYAHWAERCCRSQNVADHIIVAEQEDLITGFLALKVHKDDETEYASAVMGAVDTGQRGQGVYQKLNIYGLHWALKKGLNRLEQNVLVDNSSAHRTFASLGFYITTARATFHCLL
jgi:ribosomal protein S18 acetylase RimI-like enzyme